MCKLIWSLAWGPPAFEEASHHWEGTEPVHRGVQLTLPALGKCVHRTELSAHGWALMGLTAVPMALQRRVPPRRRLCWPKGPPEAPAQHPGETFWGLRADAGTAVRRLGAHMEAAVSAPSCPSAGPGLQCREWRPGPGSGICFGHKPCQRGSQGPGPRSVFCPKGCARAIRCTFWEAVRRRGLSCPSPVQS